MTAKKQPKSDLPARMAALYQCNQRSTGVFEVASGRMHTDYRGPQVSDFEKHIEGTTGLGGVPIMDEDVCAWAAIDIDNHDDETGADVPMVPISECIVLNKLPLIACRSKSGGVHVYLFLEKPLPAARVRQSMVNWAEMLGHPGVEVFPKQTKLMTGTDGKKQLGNWINLPYLGGDETVRYAFHNGKKLTLLQFIETAERLRQTLEQMNQSIMTEHPQAPPCVQLMMAKGVGTGQRNEAMYNTVVYLRKLDPMGYETRARDLNYVMFDKPLGKAELTRTIGSAAKPDYRFRCNEEPIKSLCDRSTCLKRKHGVSSEELERNDAMSALPAFSDMVKYLSEPIRWEVKVDGLPISNLTITQLYDWRFMREMIADRLTRVVPMIKAQEWERILQPLMLTSTLVETPEDASVAGVVRARLREFAAKTDLTSSGMDTLQRKALLRGLPTVAEVNDERCVIWRQQDFINYLKRTKSEELKGVNLWFAIRELGVAHTRMRVDDKKILNVWYIPIHALDHEAAERPVIETKL